jgi:hypothetical protein
MFWEYDGRLGRRWNLDPDLSNEFSLYSVQHNNPIVFIDKDGDEPGVFIPPCVYKGAIIGAISELAFEVFDKILLDGQGFTEALTNVDKTDILVEIAKGAASDCFTSYTSQRLEKMFSGKYRNFTLYCIKVGLEKIEGFTNEVIKDKLNGKPIDLTEKLKSFLSEEIYAAIFTAKPAFVNRIQRKSNKIRKEINKAKENYEKANDYRKKANVDNITEKQSRIYKKQENKYRARGDRHHDNAARRTAKEYTSLMGGSLGEEMYKRAEREVAKRTGKNLHLIIVGPITIPDE